jgi:hypothetical protein
MESLLQEFHNVRAFFLESNVMSKVAAPQQHALSHYVHSIKLFGALNGLCSSITESKQIDSVKKPWRNSSRNAPIFQMMTRISRLEKISSLTSYLTSLGMMWGSTSQFMQHSMTPQHVNEGSDSDEVPDSDDPVERDVAIDSTENTGNAHSDHTHTTAADEDEAADEESLDVAGITTITSSVKLARTHGIYILHVFIHGLIAFI